MESIPQSAHSAENRFREISSLGELPLHKRDRIEKNEVVEQTFTFFRDFLTEHGYHEYADNTEAFKLLPHRKIVTRREDPRKLFLLFTDDAGFTVDFESNRYSNCVEWNPHVDGARNIYNAFMEGFTNLNSVVAVIGFDADEDHDLIAMEDSVRDFHGLDRSGVRSYRGTVTQDRVHFVTLRVPGHLLPEQYLTEEELAKVDEYLDSVERTGKGSPVMVFRTFLAPPKQLH